MKIQDRFSGGVSHCSRLENGAPGRIRTSDRLVRRHARRFSQRIVAPTFLTIPFVLIRQAGRFVSACSAELRLSDLGQRL